MSQPDIKAHIDASVAEIKLFGARLDRFLGANISKILSRIKQGKVSAQQAGALLISLDNELRALGLTDLIRSSVRDSYAREVGQIKDLLAGVKSREIFTEADKVLVETLVTFKTEDIGSVVDSHLGDLREQTMYRVLGGEQPDFRAIWDDLGSKMASKVEAELNTSVAAFNRTITIKKGTDLGFNLYEYIGPSDKLTRPFCKKLLAKSPPIYDLKEIEKMDNRSDLDALIYGGGYNCRHQWRPISEEDARSEGYPTGSRSDNNING